MRYLVIFPFILVASTASFGGEGDVYGVQVESLAVIATPTGGHLRGNFEIKIKNDFELPAGVDCDRTYIITRKSVDPKGRMFALLQDAVTHGFKVGLRITDDPELTAYGGRCSLNVVRYCRDNDLPHCGL